MADLEFTAEPDSRFEPRASDDDAATDREPAPGPDPAGFKTRRGKGPRGRKAKPSAFASADSAAATWVRVGPGKFVRSDSLASTPPPPLSSETAGPADGPGSTGDEEGCGAQGSVRSVPETLPPWGETPGDLDPSDPEPSDAADDAGAVPPGGAFAPLLDMDRDDAGPDPTEAAHAVAVDAESLAFPVADAAGRSWPEPEVAESAPVAPGFSGPSVRSGPNPGDDAEPFAAVEASCPGDAVGLGVIVGPETPEVSAFEVIPGPGDHDPAPAGLSGTGSVWPESWPIEYAPAVEPGAGDAEGEAPGLVADSGFGHGPAAGFVPDASAEETSWDNGIAPDALVGSTPDVPRAVSRPVDLEADSAHDHGPEPVAEPVALPFDPAGACASATTTEAASAPIPAPSSVGVGGDRAPRLTPDARAVRPWSRVLRVTSRGPAPRRFPINAIPGGPHRPGFAGGHVRRIPPARVSGSCRPARRVRNAGRFRQADRAHPPRSPPAARRP